MLSWNLLLIFIGSFFQFHACFQWSVDESTSSNISGSASFQWKYKLTENDVTSTTMSLMIKCGYVRDYDFIPMIKKVDDNGQTEILENNNFFGRIEKSPESAGTVGFKIKNVQTEDYVYKRFYCEAVVNQLNAPPASFPSPILILQAPN